jgi:hypothetical protein
MVLGTVYAGTYHDVSREKKFSPQLPLSACTDKAIGGPNFRISPGNPPPPKSNIFLFCTYTSLKPHPRYALCDFQNKKKKNVLNP